MRSLKEQELNRLSDVQADVMNDLCNIYTVTMVSGTYGTNTTKVRVGVTNIPCGIHFTNGATVERGQVLLVDYDVLLRIPSDRQVSISSEIELVEKGETVVSGTFNLYAEPKFNSSVQLLQLKRVK